ncbi:MAG: tetratricopeptide repeat protein [Cyclobacteriaceae bacterium]|nr:tetratricopeptide repeat protein [Cyclobacteriaceae bacterium]
MTKSPTICFLLVVMMMLTTQAVAQPNIDKGKELYSSKKYKEAENVFQAVQKNSPDFAAAQYYLGRIAYDKKEYDDAADYFEKSTEADPGNGDYFAWLGDAYSGIGSKAGFFTQMSVGPKALRAWEKAAKLDPKNISARASLVSSYMMAPAFMGGGEEKAKAVGAEVLALLDEALKNTPENYLYHYWYGKSSAITGLKLDKGEASLQKYLTHTPSGDEPSLAAAYMRLGQINEKQGRKAEARKNYEVALKLDNKLKGAQEGLERISK